LKKRAYTPKDAKDGKAGLGVRKKEILKNAASFHLNVPIESWSKKGESLFPFPGGVRIKLGVNWGYQRRPD